MAPANECSLNQKCCAPEEGRETLTDVNRIRDVELSQIVSRKRRQMTPSVA